MNKDLLDRINQINQMYQQTDLDLAKNGASQEQRQQARDLMNAAKQKAVAELGDDLSKLNTGKPIKVSGATSLGVDLDQSKLPDMAKVKNLGKGNMFRRLKGSLRPGLGALAGVGLAAAQGLVPEDAAAAEAIQAVGRATQEGDPTSLLFPENVGEGSDQPLDVVPGEATWQHMTNPKQRERVRRFSKIRNLLEDK